MSPNTNNDGSQIEPEILSATGLAKSAETGLGIANFLQPPIKTATSASDPNNWFNKSVNKMIAVIKWVIKDFKLRHLVKTFSLFLIDICASSRPYSLRSLVS
jgi:hypothetical protein